MAGSARQRFVSVSNTVKDFVDTVACPLRVIGMFKDVYLAIKPILRRVKPWAPAVFVIMPFYTAEPVITPIAAVLLTK